MLWQGGQEVIYTSSYCQSVITGRDGGTQWKIPMTGQCLHHPKIRAEACAISQWRTGVRL